MPYYGQYKNGVIVLNEPVKLPEGALVKVEPVARQERENKSPRKWKGLFRNAGPIPTEDDILQMRKEAWPES